MVSIPAHAAFPSLPPPSATTSSSASSSTNQLPPIPTTAVQIRNLIKACDTPSAIHDVLIPTLHKVSQGEGQGNTSSSVKDRMRLGEEILCLSDDDSFMRMNEREISTMTAGLVYVVSARLSRSGRGANAASADTFNLAGLLCVAGDPTQLNQCIARVSLLAWGILRYAQQTKQPELALDRLTSLCNIAYVPHTFSGIHAAYLEACLLTRSYIGNPGIPDLTFTDVAPNTTYLDVLTYHHHAGLICAAKKDFARAKQYFIVAVTAPAQVASAIQLASAKRAILCELLSSGKHIEFPKYISTAVNRVFERNAAEYIKLAKAFEAQEWSAVKEISEKKEFNDDNNGGLLIQVLQSIPKRRVLKSKETFSRIRLGQLAAIIGLEGEAGGTSLAATLNEMVESGSIFASIVPSVDSSAISDAIVTFSDPPRSYISKDVIAQIDQANAMASWLERSLVRGNREKGIDKEWLKKQAALAEASHKNGKQKSDDFDTMMAAEEMFVDRGGRGVRGAGGNHGDKGF